MLIARLWQLCSSVVFCLYPDTTRDLSIFPQAQQRHFHHPDDLMTAPTVLGELARLLPVRTMWAFSMPQATHSWSPTCPCCSIPPIILSINLGLIQSSALNLLSLLNSHA